MYFSIVLHLWSFPYAFYLPGIEGGTPGALDHCVDRFPLGMSVVNSRIIDEDATATFGIEHIAAAKEICRIAGVLQTSAIRLCVLFDCFPPI